MNDKHTPEPWGIGTPPPNGEQTIGDSKGLMVAVATTGHGVSSEANARRIVACVNACAGIPTVDLEMDNSMFIKRLKSIYELEEQRDELLADIERCYRMLLSEPDTQGALFKAENILREAIAGAKEKK